MTAASLGMAVTVGLVLGLLVGWLVPACRAVPFWLPVAVGVGAAIFGTVAARLARVDTSWLSPVELALQVLLAGLGLAAVAVTVERKPPTSRPGTTDERR